MRPSQAMLVVLMAGCGALITVGAMIIAGVGQGIESDVPVLREHDERFRELAIAPFPQEDLEAYALVTERPLFNDDRRPRPPEERIDEPPETPEHEQVALDVTINGIIITPDIKLAMVTDNTENTTHRLREGMPLEGAQSAWVLASIEPRRLVFEGGGEQAAEVELAVYTQALQGGAPPPRRTPVRTVSPVATDTAVQEEGDEGDPAYEEVADDQAERARKAEEIRRRVAERRAQLRAAAALRRAEQEEEN